MRTKLNAYLKHTLAVMIGIATGYGILDPVTGQIHVSGWHVLEHLGIGTAVALIVSYAGLGASTKDNKNETPSNTGPNTASQKISTNPIYNILHPDRLS